MTDPREKQLKEAHVLPLMELICSWRSQGWSVPSIDPLDGGIRAKALFLLESPGPQAVGSNYISRDNPDPSARNMADSLARAGLAREDTLLWNVVPYCVATRERNRNASSTQIKGARDFTQAFINCLPNLRAIVFCGRKAQIAKPLLVFSARAFSTFHTGAMSFNRPAYRGHILSTFAEVSTEISRNRFSDMGDARFNAL